ncbi:hypothetical protein TNCT6_21400 [Streptomyces sp. 6-11-2]|nr:hypothetical protein TNCT6_21400 [Streptomyces sp. 6-11-2]
MAVLAPAAFLLRGVDACAEAHGSGAPRSWSVVESVLVGAVESVLVGAVEPVLAGAVEPVLAGAVEPVLAGAVEPVLAGAVEPVLAGGRAVSVVRRSQRSGGLSG